MRADRHGVHIGFLPQSTPDNNSWWLIEVRLLNGTGCGWFLWRDLGHVCLGIFLCLTLMPVRSYISSLCFVAVGFEPLAQVRGYAVSA
jgi:hypothetical protein